MSATDWIAIAAIIISLIVGGGTTLTIIWSGRQDRQKEEMSAHLLRLDQAMKDAENRLVRLEEGIRHLPTNETNSAAFRLLYDKLDDLRDKVANLKGTQELASAITVQLSRIVGPPQQSR